MRYLGPETDIDLNVGINTKTESKFKGFNHELMPESETIFSKIYVKNGQKKYLKFKTLKIHSWTYVIKYLSGEELLQLFMNKNFKNLSRLQNTDKEKRGKFNDNGKGQDNSINSWNDKLHIFISK